MRRTTLALFLALALVLSTLTGVSPVRAQDRVYTDAMDSAVTGLLSTETFDPSISFTYRNGQFVVDVQQPSYQGDIISTLSVPELANSRLSVDASISGDSANKYVIAGCRHTDAGEGYFFGYLPATGDLIIWRRDATGDTNIAQSVDASLIAPAGATYQIGIECWTNNITGVVDGQPVLSAFDDTYAQGRPTVGVGANGRQTDGLSVAFDNLTVTDNGNLAFGSETPASASVPPSTDVLDVVLQRERTAALTQTPLVTGQAGALTQVAGTFSWIGVESGLTDFYATVTYTNPTDLSTPSDVGLGFRSNPSPDGGYRFVLTSAGEWYLQVGPGEPFAQGIASAYDPTPGASNTIEVIARGASGLIAVNGVALGQVDLSAVPGAGDIYVGTAFYVGNELQDRLIPYEGLSVYPLAA
jgi:hypothetical protein